MPERGSPPSVTGLQVGMIDPTTVHLTWDATPGAGGYFLSRRNINEAGSQLEPLELGGEASMPCADIYFQFPGTWNYE